MLPRAFVLRIEAKSRAGIILITKALESEAKETRTMSEKPVASNPAMFHHKIP
jgi:hypothetical protein